MQRCPSPEMQTSIRNHLRRCSEQRRMVIVDGLAEQIQSQHPAENIALEDISEFITRVAINHQFGVALPRQSSIRTGNGAATNSNSDHSQDVGQITI